MMSGFVWPAGCRAGVAVTFDVDAESAILGGWPATVNHLSTMTHQRYGPQVGVPRLLRMLNRLHVRATFFVPGYTADCYPATVEAIVEHGHEVAAHGYLHEVPTDMTPDQERHALGRGMDALERVTGARPVGYRAPMWSLTYDSPQILAESGITYDSSLMDGDHPYLLATEPHRLVEFPVHWALDDWEPYAFIPGITGSGVISRPKDVMLRWWDEFVATYDVGGLFIITGHPFLSGRPSRARALGDLLERVLAHGDLWTGDLGQLATYVATLDLEPRAHLPHRPDTTTARSDLT